MKRLCQQVWWSLSHTPSGGIRIQPAIKLSSASCSLRPLKKFYRYLSYYTNKPVWSWKGSTVLRHLMGAPIQLYCICSYPFLANPRTLVYLSIFTFASDREMSGYTAWASEVTVACQDSHPVIFSQIMRWLMNALRCVQVSKAQYVAVC